MNTPAPLLSVQICSYNRAALIGRCLDALALQRLAPEDLEIVVVDDGSRDDTAAVLRDRAGRSPFGVVALTQEHRGLAAARNAGIRAARGEVIVFVDDDTIPHPDLAAEHWRSHQREPRIVVLGRVRHFSATSPPRRFPRLADLSTSFFWTTNVSARRRHLLDAGLFDESFTEYGWEDLELGDRLKALGLVRRVNWRAVVDHQKETPGVADVTAILARAEQSGRSAARYLRARPLRHVRLATGLTPARRFVVRLLQPLESRLLVVDGDPGSGRLSRSARARCQVAAMIRYYRSAESALRTDSPAPGKPERT